MSNFESNKKKVISVLCTVYEKRLDLKVILHWNKVSETLDYLYHTS